MHIADKKTAIILWSRISDNGPDAETEKLMERITGRPVPSFRFEEDRARHLTGLALAEYGAFRMRGRCLPVETGEGGKPFFPGSDLFFNISHAGDIVVCGFSLSPIGVDVERPGRKIEKVADRYFHSDEVRWIRREGFDPEKALLLWSYKESFLKRNGEGVGRIRGLDSMVDEEGPVSDYGDAHFACREVMPGYRVVSCTDRDVEERACLGVRHTELKGLIQNLLL